MIVSFLNMQIVLLKLRLHAVKEYMSSYIHAFKSSLNYSTYNIFGQNDGPQSFI